MNNSRENCIMLTNNILPTVIQCDLLATDTPFIHSDRVLDFHVMIYVTQGVIYVTEEDTDYAIGAGELLILKAGKHHYGKTEIPKGTTWHYIHFFLPEGNEKCNEFVYPDYSPFIPHKSSASYMIVPKVTSGLANTDVERRIISFTNYYTSDNPIKKWDINIRLFELLTQVALYLASPYEYKMSDRICNYISKHAEMPFSSNDISKEFHLSYKQLSAIFKREQGISMQQYHTKLRMDKACHLLKASLLDINEIAVIIGYSDPLFFSRQFHKFTGYSPREYRKLPKSY